MILATRFSEQAACGSQFAIHPRTTVAASVTVGMDGYHLVEELLVFAVALAPGRDYWQRNIRKRKLRGLAEFDDLKVLSHLACSALARRFPTFLQS